MDKYIDFKTLINLGVVLTDNLDKLVRNALNKASAAVSQIEQATSSNWHNIVKPLQDSLYDLRRSWGVLEHLKSVSDGAEIRELHRQLLPIITEFYVNLDQNEILYKHIDFIKQHQYALLDHEQQKVIDNQLRDFRLSGMNLSVSDRAEYKHIQNQLSELSSQFGDNVLDATDGFAKIVTKDQLIGIPEDSIALYAELAKKAGLDDAKYKISLHAPSYLPIIQYAANRSLREELYRAYVSRASEFGEAKLDNSEIIRQILRLKARKAQLLGFADFAELSLYTKMAESPAQVLDFLDQLLLKAKPIAEHELKELTAFAKQLDNIDHLEAWDLPYYSEKLQQHKYSYSNNELKQYFQLDHVFSGMFDLVKRLFAVEFVVNKDLDTWHNDVLSYTVNKDGKAIGYLYLDLYARDGKQSGAWMNAMQERYFDENKQHLPIAYIVCNFTQPLDNKSSLLTFDELQTLLHEMGHALHHLLTKVNNYALASLDSVEWDAVELPSQFMENFVWDYEILKTLSCHVQTNEVIPRKLFDNILAARYYLAGLQTLRQVEFATFDLLLYSASFDLKAADYNRLLAEVRAKVSPIKVPAYNRMPNSFLHIFAGGYAAGYYSYKWAEVLSSDVFAYFDGKDGDELTILGLKYLDTILSRGGTRQMIVNFREFSGRDPQIDALLKYSGIIAN